MGLRGFRGDRLPPGGGGAAQDSPGRRPAATGGEGRLPCGPRARARPPAVPISNETIAVQLEEIADLLEIEGENPFRIRSYRNAARELRDLPGPVAELVEAGFDLTELRGIGEGIAKKIVELVRTGHLEYLEKLERETGPGLAELLAVPGLGPKRVKKIHDELGVSSAEDLLAAARAGKLAKLSGLGEATQRKILEALERRTTKKARVPWATAAPVAEALLAHLRSAPGVERAELAGSFRRRRESVGDLDVLVVAQPDARVPEHFVAFDGVREVLAQGPSRAAVRLDSGLQVDLRVVPAESFGAAWHYFTGSKAHNVAVRRLAQAKGLKINEYGVFGPKGRRAGAEEADLYRAVGLAYIEPELRENRGEIEAAAHKKLPKLVEEGDLRGDLHVHTDASDGRDDLAAMLAAAKARGLAYVAITDHAGHLGVAGALKPDALKRHAARVRKAGAAIRGLRVLAGAEVDIRRDGSLALPDAVLDELDVVVCALHSHLDLPPQEQTRRLLAALEHPRCQILAHPSGRLLEEREPARFDLEALLAAAAERGVALEVNGQPKRLDLDDVTCRAAKQAGVPVVLCSDAHSAPQLAANLSHALAQARRGWLEARDVLNTLPWRELSPRLRQR